MDERSTDQTPQENQRPRLGGRRIVTALMVAGLLAAVPAGVALAGDSGGSSSGGGNSSGAGTLPVQSTTPEQGRCTLPGEPSCDALALYEGRCPG